MDQLPSKSVFIADDDEDDRLLLQLAFAQYNPECHLFFAKDGMALLDALAQVESEPCLIILDLNMPRLNGFEALHILRTNLRYEHTPIVILTTSNQLSDLERADELGADDFLTKPLHVESLGKTVLGLRKTWHLDKCM